MSEDRRKTLPADDQTRLNDARLTDGGSPRTRYLMKCFGKVRFESRALAQRVGRRRRERGFPTSAAYKCSQCGGWHVGSDRDGRRRR